MTSPSAVDPRCVCCGNAYGTRYLCEVCRADPANAGWSEADELEMSCHELTDGQVKRLEGAHFGERLGEEVPVWNPTELQRTILRLHLAGGVARGIASVTGSSIQYVRRVLKEFKLKVNRE